MLKALKVRLDLLVLKGPLGQRDLLVPRGQQDKHSLREIRAPPPQYNLVSAAKTPLFNKHYQRMNSKLEFPYTKGRLSGETNLPTG